jgi:hypothetical protein
MKVGTLDAKAIAKLLADRHPKYLAACETWCLIDDVTGATVPEFAERHLFQHGAEYEKSFTRRKARAYWHQVSLAIRTSYVNHLLKVPPTFNAAADGAEAEPAPDACDALWKKATRDGRSFLAYLREIAERVADKGVLWVGQDRPPVSPGPSRLTEKGTEPYCYSIDPEDLLDGKIDGGRLVWALVRETFRDDEHPVSSSKRVLERYRLWTDEESVAIVPIIESSAKSAKPKYRAEAPVPHPIGRVPIVFFGYGDGEPCFARPGLLHAIAYMDRSIFNLCSQYDTILVKQTFSQLAVPTNAVLQDDEGDLTEDGRNFIKVGEEEVFAYPPEAKGPPSYVAAPSHPAETLKAGIEGLLDMCFMLACLDGEHTAQATKTGQSGGPTAGVTMAYVFDKLNARLTSFADGIERGANDLMHMARQWMGEQLRPEDTDRDLVKMPDSFDVKSLAQDVMESLTIKSLGITSPTFDKLLQKEAVRKRYPNLDEATLKKIDAEIEAGDPYDMAGEPGPQDGEEGADDDDGGSSDGEKDGGKDDDEKGQKRPGFRSA